MGLLLGLAVFIGSVFFLSMHLADRYSRLDQETVLKLKTPITPDQEKKILDLTTPLLGPPSNASKPRVIILGMDGLDHQYLDPLIQEGKLPNFKKLIAEGAKGTLLSIVPPSSAGAWPSMVTGCNPGKTNLLNFRVYDPISRKIVLTDGRDLRRPALWDILGLYGKKSIVINEPMSYPPHKIKGVMISGLLAPEEGVYTYPTTLSPLLNEVGYKREAVPKGEGFSAPQSTLLSDLLFTEKKRLDLALLLMEKNDWDLFFCMFSSTDRMMHHIGRHFSLKDLRTNIIEMDTILGAFLDHLPEETTLLLVSDHGFTFYPNKFSIPRWLEKEGYWVLPKKQDPQPTPLFHIAKFLKTLEERADLPDIPGLRWPAALQKDDITPPVDWEKSSAIAVETGGNWGSIRILDPKKPVGHLEAHWGIGYRKLLKKEISEKLSLLEDPETREKVVKKILEREALFNGPYQEEMPDLVFELSKMRVDFAFSDHIFREEPVYHHRREGVLFAYGEKIRKSALLDDAQIVDITPTVLYLLEIPIAEDLDGKLLESILEKSSLALQIPQWTPRYPEKGIEWVGDYDQRMESSEDVKENLRSLGYLQ